MVFARTIQNWAKAGPRWFIKNWRRMMAHAVEDAYPPILARTLVIRGSEDKLGPSG